MFRNISLWAPGWHYLFLKVWASGIKTGFFTADDFGGSRSKSLTNLQNFTIGCFCPLMLLESWISRWYDFTKFHSIHPREKNNILRVNIFQVTWEVHRANSGACFVGNFTSIPHLWPTCHVCSSLLFQENFKSTAKGGGVDPTYTLW